MVGDDPAIAAWYPVLMTIGLVEQTERPPAIRALEWLSHSVISHWRPLTCGPLQMQRCPWGFTPMISKAILRLQEGGVDPRDHSVAMRDRIASVWNGRASAYGSQPFGYSDALGRARDLLERSQRARLSES